MNKKTKVLHLVESFGGGVFSFLTDLVNQKDSDYDITIAYGIRKETPENFKDYFNNNVNFIEIKNFTRDINLKKDLKAIKEIKKLVKELNPDIVQMHSSKAGAIGRLAISAKGRKLLYNPHGFSFLKKDESKFKRLLYKILEKFLSLRKCVIVGCSKGEYNEAMKISGNCICINNGLNINKIDNVIENLNSIPKSCNKLRICTVGRIDFAKNPKIFNEIAKEFPNIEFTWVGEGFLREELTSKNITVTGWKEKKEVLGLLNENDIFILTSLWEGLPYALLEAMYMEKICIVSNCIGNRDVIKNNENGFICSELEDYKKTIQNIIDNKINTTKIVKRAKEDVENNYNIDLMAEQYKNLYKKTILHIVNSNSFSGLERVAINIIKSLEDRYNSYYVTQDGPIIDKLEKENVNRIKIDKMSTREIRRICKEYKPDIIHAHDYTATIYCASSFVKNPIISHLHNNSPWIKKMHPYSFALLFASLRVKKFLIVSDAIKNEYIFSKLIGRKFENIGNPVSVDEVIKNVLKETKKEYDICFVGRLTKAKNPIKFINIVSELKKDIPNIKAIMLGDGELRNECKAEIQKLNLLNNIDLKGFVDNPYNIMAKSKVFCLTSDWEGYGLVAFDALALGMPSFTTPVGGLVNIVDDSCGRLCNKNYEFVESIRDILYNNDLYQYKSNNAINKSKELENMKQYMQRLDEIYNKIN